MTDAGIGHNEPPEGDPFELALEEKNQDLWKRWGALEMRRLKLPKEPATEEEAALITAWTAETRELGRDFEKRRVEIKAPNLKREQQIDAKFNGQRKTIASKADEIEQRNGPYLRAKREREEAERREQARIAREKQEALELAAAESRRLAQEAEQRRLTAEREAREAEQTRVRDAEAKRVREEEAEAARNAPQPEKPTAEVVPIKPGPTAAENEAAMRQAGVEEARAQRAADLADEAARKAGVAANRAEKKADQTGQLGKVSAGGANQRATMVWVGKVTNFGQVLQSLGPLGPFFNETVIQDAVARAARHPDRPAIPGVSYSEQLDVKTTATRSKTDG